MADIAIEEKKLAKTLKRRLYRKYAKQDSEALEAFPVPLGLFNKVIALVPPFLPLDHFDREKCDKAIDNNIWALKELHDIKARIRERERLKPSSAENNRLKEALEAYLNKKLETVAESVSLESYSGHKISLDNDTLKSMLFPPTYFDTFKHYCYQSYLLSPLRFLLLVIPVILAVIFTPLYCVYLGGKKLFGARQQAGGKRSSMEWTMRQSSGGTNQLCHLLVQNKRNGSKSRNSERNSNVSRFSKSVKNMLEIFRSSRDSKNSLDGLGENSLIEYESKFTADTTKLKLQVKYLHKGGNHNSLYSLFGASSKLLSKSPPLYSPGKKARNRKSPSTAG